MSIRPRATTNTRRRIDQRAARLDRNGGLASYAGASALLFSISAYWGAGRVVPLLLWTLSAAVALLGLGVWLLASAKQLENQYRTAVADTLRNSK